MDRASHQYSKFAASYEKVLGNIYSLAAEKIDAFFKSLPAGAELVDIGCGPGFESAAAARFGLRVTGLDACPEMIARFRQNVPGGTAVVGTIEALPFADASFAALFSSCVLLHVNREEGRRALGEFNRVLAPGGAAMLVTTLAGGEEDLHSRPALSAVGVEELYFYHWEKSDLEKNLTAAGFTILNVETRALVPNRPLLAFYLLKN